MNFNLDWGSFNNAFANTAEKLGQIPGQLIQGVQMGQRNNALRAFATNPNDPNAINALAQVDPALAMQAREKQATTAAAERKEQAELSEASRANILKGARIVRQVQPKDEAGYQRAKAMAQSMGIDVSTLPPTWGPEAQQLVQSMTALADTFEPPKADNRPASVEEFEYAKSQGFKGDFMQYMETKQGPISVKNEDGTVTLYPRGTIGSQPSAAGGAVPPPPPGFQIIGEGGQPSPTAGTFQDPLAPL